MVVAVVKKSVVDADLYILYGTKLFAVCVWL